MPIIEILELCNLLSPSLLLLLLFWKLFKREVSHCLKRDWILLCGSLKMLPHCLVIFARSALKPCTISSPRQRCKAYLPDPHISSSISLSPLWSSLSSTPWEPKALMSFLNNKSPPAAMMFSLQNIPCSKSYLLFFVFVYLFVFNTLFWFFQL